MNRLDDILRAARGLRPPRDVALPPIAREVWDRAVGSRIACRAQPVRLERGVLLIRVASAAWANELSLLGEEIRRQLADQGLSVEALRFVVGRVEVADRPPQPRRRAASPDVPLPEGLRGPMAKIDDPELRRALEVAAATTLHLRK